MGFQNQLSLVSKVVSESAFRTPVLQNRSSRREFNGWTFSGKNLLRSGNLNAGVYSLSLSLSHATSLLYSYSVVLLSFSLGGTLSREIKLHQITAPAAGSEKRKGNFY